MKTSRQQVLEYIQMQKVATAADISRALQMTEANARHHLSLLESQGLVEIVGKRPPAGKGRPKSVYGISLDARGHNLSLLVDILLEQFVATLPEEQRVKAIKGLAERMAASTDEVSIKSLLGSMSAKPHPLTHRLLTMVQWLNAHHYGAHWEAHVNSPRIILGYCPYETVIDDHPELCQMDRYLLLTLSGVPVDQLAKRAADGRGAKHCIFAVGKS